MQKIKTVRFHQAVQIGPTPVTYLTPDTYMSLKGGQKFSHMEQTADGVKIELSDSTVLVGWSNIAYLVLDKPAEEAEKPKAAKTK